MKIVQSWDDGVLDDVALVEIFRRCGATACFNLTPGFYKAQRSFGWMYEDRYPVWWLARPELTEVYAGFEIACHSLTHPRLTQLPPEPLQVEITESRRQLEEIFQRPIPGFCYPFNNYNETVKAALRAAGYRFARGAREQANAFPPADPLEFSPACHILNPDFWKLYEDVKAADGVFYFWGHAYEIGPKLGWETFAAWIERISNDPAAEWVEFEDLFAAA